MMDSHAIDGRSADSCNLLSAVGWIPRPPDDVTLRSMAGVPAISRNAMRPESRVAARKPDNRPAR